MKRSLVILLILLNTLCIWGQSSIVEQLEQSLDTTSGVDRIDILNEISFALFDFDNTKSLTYSRQAYKESIEMLYKYGEAESLFNIGYYYFLENNFDLSEIHFLNANEVFSDLNEDNNIGITNFYLGNIYTQKSQYDIAKSKYLEACEDFKKSNNPESITLSYNNIASIFTNVGKYDSALVYIDKIVEIRKNNNLPPSASEKSKVGQIYLAWEQYDDARIAFKEALEISSKNNNIIDKAHSLNNLGLVYIKQGTFNIAKKHILNAHTLFNEIEFTEGIATTYYSLGLINTATENYQEAESFYNKSLSLLNPKTDGYQIAKVLNSLGYSYAKTINLNMALTSLHKSLAIADSLNTLFLKHEIYKNLADLYTQTNEYEVALDYYKLYVTTNNAIFNNKNVRQLAEIRAKHETVDQIKNLDVLTMNIEMNQIRLKKNRAITIILISLILVTIIGASIILTWIRVKEKHKTIELEQALLRSRMNPHFIFNSLNIIQSLIYLNKNKDAGKYLSKFAHLMRQILEMSAKKYVLLSEEIQSIENYCLLQKLRFNEKLNYNIFVSDEINIETTSIPPLMVQPLIENAIEHGILNKTEPGCVYIRFMIIDDKMTIEVEDDGIGRVAAAKHKKEHQSMATNIITRRLETYNAFNNKQMRLFIEDNYDKNGDACGTTVRIILPHTDNEIPE